MTAAIYEVLVWEGPAASDGYGELLAQVPAWTSLSMSPLGSAQGAGSISIPLSSSIFRQADSGGTVFTPDTTPVLAYETLWQCKKDGQVVFEFLAQSVDRTTVAADETQTVTVSGPDTSQVLNWGTVMPAGWSPVPTYIPVTATVQDGFSEQDSSGHYNLDTTLWNLSTPGAASIAPGGGSARVTLAPGGGAYLGAGDFVFTNSSFSASVAQAQPYNTAAAGVPNGSDPTNGSDVTQMIIKPSSGTGYMMMALSFSSFYCQYQDINGTVTEHTIANGAGATGGGAYSTSAYQYWRMSADLQSGGAILYRWWTSGDGATWTLQFSHTAIPHTASGIGWDTASVGIYLGGIYNTSGTSNGAYAEFTSLNGEIQVQPNAGPVYLNVPIMETLVGSIEACQRRGTIPFVQWNFSSSTDSRGTAWSDKWSVQLPVGTDLLTLLQNYAGAIDGDWRMLPGYILEAGQEGDLGQHLGGSVVFHEGEVTQLGRTQARDKIYNMVSAADAGGQIHTQTNAASITKWAQRELWISSGGTIDAASAVNTAAAGVNQFDDEVDARVIQIPPNQRGKTAFTDFGIFDWIGIERGDFAATESVRVMGITITVDQDGAETHELILQTYRQALVQYFQYLVNKLGGQSASALGALAITAGIPSSALGTAGGSPNQLGAVTGTSGLTGLQAAPTLAALPEVATALPQVLPGTIIKDASLPQTALSFTLPSGTKVTFAASAPAEPLTGDLWYDTGNGNKLYQWDGSSWQAYQFGIQAVSFTATDIGGITVYVQGTAPGGTINAGSLWYDTSNGYQLNVYASGSWSAYQFGTNAIAAGSVTTAILAANAVTAAKIAANTITASQIAANTITAAQIASGTITASQIASGTILASNLAAGIVVSGIVDGTTIEGTYFIAGTGGGTAWQNATPNTPGYFIYYDPGASATTPIVPSSGSPSSNSNAYLVKIVISGGSVSNVVVDGLSVGTGDGTYYLPAGLSITLTYSSAPTWTWTQVPALVFAATADGGNDQWFDGTFGNNWPGGTYFGAASANTQNVMTVAGDDGGVLANIDSSGNISGQTLSAGTDLLLSGASLTALLADAAQGLVNYGYIAANPWPSSPLSSSVTALFELDSDFTAGRIYEFVMLPTTIRSNTANATVALELRYTTDGSTPSTSSSLVTYVGKVLPVANSGDAHPGLRVPFFPTADATYKFLVCGLASSGTWYFTQDPYIRCMINDLGANNNGQSSNNINAIGSGTGGGSSQQTYTKYYNASHCYWYAGSTGHVPNTLLVTDGQIRQGGDYADTYYGDCYSWILWPYSTIQSDLSGATVNWVKLTVHCKYTYYSSGATLQVGDPGTSSFPSTTLQPSSIPDQVNQHVYAGGWYTFYVSGWGANFKSGAAKSTLMAANTGNLSYKCDFYGLDSQLIINYTK